MDELCVTFHSSIIAEETSEPSDPDWVCKCPRKAAKVCNRLLFVNLNFEIFVTQCVKLSALNQTCFAFINMSFVILDTKLCWPGNGPKSKSTQPLLAHLYQITLLSHKCNKT